MLDDFGGNKFTWEEKYRRILNNHPVSSSSENQLLITDVLMSVQYFRKKHNEDGEYLSEIMHETMNYFNGSKMPISNNKGNRYGQDDFERVMFNLNELLKWLKRYKMEKRKDSINKIFK